jgi:hypothetical protein
VSSAINSRINHKIVKNRLRLSCVEISKNLFKEYKPMKNNSSTKHSNIGTFRHLAKRFSCPWMIAVVLIVATATVAIAQGGGGYRGSGGGYSSGGGGYSSGGSYNGGGGYTSGIEYGSIEYNSSGGHSSSGREFYSIFLIICGIYFFWLVFGKGIQSRITRFKTTQEAKMITNLINLVIILRNGSSYVPAINQLTLHANLQTDRGRQSFLKQLTTLLNPNDVIDGFLRFPSSQNGYSLWERQKKLSEIQDLVTNIARPNQNPVVQDNRPISMKPIPVGDTYCIIGVILESSTPKKVEIRELVDLRKALPKLCNFLTLSGNFYYYFGPTTTGVSLSEVQTLFEKILEEK